MSLVTEQKLSYLMPTIRCIVKKHPPRNGSFEARHEPMLSFDDQAHSRDDGYSAEGWKISATPESNRRNCETLLRDLTPTPSGN